MTQTPQQAFETLMQELSASGSIPINASTEGHAQPNKTLRGAIAAIFWKTNALLPLSKRPVDPKVWDDLYGHVLSLRTEHLITQAIVTDLAARLGTDVVKIRQQVLEALNS